MSDKYEQIGVAVTCRSFGEYVRMFDLEERPLAGRILDIAGGASSFTADAVAGGLDAYAADPRYALDSEALVGEALEEIAAATAKIEKLAHQFDFSYYGSVANHRANREASLRRFDAHFGQPEEREARYKAGSLPNLPFAPDSFDRVLCSHFLFLYEEQFDYAFHRDAVLEMMRVCKPGGEIRIYPVMSLGWTPYAHMDELLNDIRGAGGSPEYFTAKLPFIPGSTLGLIVKV